MDFVYLKAGAELQNGKYRIERVLGQGGFGITYLAVNTLFDSKVAIKEFFPKDYCDRDSSTSYVTIGTTLNTELVHKLKGKFLREARNIARLDNDHIVSVSDVFEENDTAYYVMKYIEGETLKDFVDRDGPMTESEALGYLTPVARAVEYMHSRRMNHLDLKPANIMVRRSDGQPVLIDFGSSKQYDKEGDATSSMMPGLTHGYAPMEQYHPGGVAQFSPQSDVYALGATLIFLLTGKKPPRFSEIMEDGLPELPAAVSNTTRRAIEHAMQPLKHDRPESIAQFLKELPAPATAHPLQEPKQPTPPPVPNAALNVAQKKQLAEEHDETSMEAGAIPPYYEVDKKLVARAEEAERKVATLQSKVSKLKKSKILFIILFIFTCLILIISFISNFSTSKSLSEANSQRNNLVSLRANDSEKFQILKEKQLVYISSMEVCNEGEEFGEKIYSKNTTYIIPKIHVVNLSNEPQTLGIKFYTPWGLATGEVSKDGYSYTEELPADFSGWDELIGWGSTTKGHWAAGSYRIEIWSDGKCLYTYPFTIY